MSKKNKSSRKVITLDAESRMRLRVAAEDVWKTLLPRTVEKFLSLFRDRSPNFRIAPFKIEGLEQKRRTKPQEQVLLKSGAKMFDAFVTAMLAQSDPQQRKEHWDKHEEWKRNYDKALAGKLSDSPEKLKAFIFLRDWCNAEIHDSESADLETVTLTLPLRIIYLMPLLAALNCRNAGFFEGLAPAMRILRRYEKDTLGKWLLEHRHEIKPYLPDEIPKKFPQCPTKSVKQVRNKLNELKLDHAEKPRGQYIRGFKKGWAELKTGLTQA